MREDNARKAKLIEALIKKNKALMQSLLAEKKPAKLIILQEGEAVPEATPGENFLYVTEVQSPYQKEIARSEQEVDMTPPTRRSPAYQNPQMN